MIRRLEEENLTYAFPEVAFDEDYVIATYQARVKTSNIERLAMAIADEPSWWPSTRSRTSGATICPTSRPCTSFSWPTPCTISPPVCRLL